MPLEIEYDELTEAYAVGLAEGCVAEVYGRNRKAEAEKLAVMPDRITELERQLAEVVARWEAAQGTDFDSEEWFAVERWMDFIIGSYYIELRRGVSKATQTRATTNLEAELAEARAENERLLAALRQAYLDELYTAYNNQWFPPPGHEHAGEWSHSYMSEGEWLARECGLDPRKCWYSVEGMDERMQAAADKLTALAQQGGEEG